MSGTPRTTTYAYDGLDRLALVDFPTDADWVFTYDASSALNQKGRLSFVTNGIVTTDREYSARGDLALERTTIGGASYAVAYGYDAGGNLVSVQAPSGVTASYAFSGGRPKTLTVTAGVDQQIVRNIAFAPFGGRTRAEFPPFNGGTGLNTVVSTRTYNLRGQVATLQVASPGGTVLDQSFDYAYTAGGAGPVDAGPNLDRVIDNRDANESRFYFYDPLDRLWKSTTLAGVPLYAYGYDANGNRTQEVAPGGTTNTGYEAATDRIAQATGANAKYFAHDVYGSRIWAGPSAYAGLPSHVYNELNRLVEVRDSTTQAVLGQYTYDAFGRRVRKITASGMTLVLLRRGRAPHRRAQPRHGAPRRARLHVDRGGVGRHGRLRPAADKVLMGAHGSARHAARRDKLANHWQRAVNLARELCAIWSRDGEPGSGWRHAALRTPPAPSGAAVGCGEWRALQFLPRL